MNNVHHSRVEEPAAAEVYDNALRGLVPSRTDPHVSYLVELNEAPRYDVCQCLWFQTTLGPLLARGFTPERAVAEGLVKLKKGEDVADALKCWHIRQYYKRLATETKKFLCAQAKAAHRNAH